MQQRKPKTSYPEFNSYYKMLQRCNNPENSDYDRYGAKGITTCPTWDDFFVFLKDMGPRPTSKHTIERIDNSKGYSKDNCKWATRYEQAQNRSSTLFLDYDGEKLSLSEVARRTGIDKATLSWRVKKFGKDSPLIYKRQRRKKSI